MKMQNYRQLLDSSNVWREKVVVGSFWGIPGLPRPVKLELLDLLTSQLDCELTSHNTKVESLKRQMSVVFQKGASCSR